MHTIQLVRVRVSLFLVLFFIFVSLVFATQSSNLINAGVSAMTTGDYATATADFSQAMSLATIGSHDLEAAQFYLIKTYLKMGDTTDMQMEYQSLLQRNPQSPALDSLDFLFGTYYYEHSKNYTASLQYLSDLVLNHPNSSYYENALFYLMRDYVKLGDETDMLAQYQVLTTRNPHSVYLKNIDFLFGTYYYDNAAWGKATSWYNDLIQNYPQSSDRSQALLDQMALSTWAGDSNEVMQSYSLLTSTYTDITSMSLALAGLGQFYIELGAYTTAENCFNHAITNYPTYPWGIAENHNGLGATYIHEQKYTQAFSQYQTITAMSINSTWNAYAEDFMGFIYSVQKDYSDAILQYQHIINTYTSQTNYQAQSQYRIGDCYSRQKLYDDALNAYQRVLSQYPTSSWVGPAQANIQALHKELGQ